jgi:antitoxin component of MazEF toxin-antitoxin module
MPTMEHVDTSKIIRRGARSLAIPLPAALARRFGLGEGSAVEFHLDDGRLVLIFPAGEEPKGEGPF